MPCRSYDTDWFEEQRSYATREARLLKAEADKLARIACNAMSELEKFDPELSVIKDMEARKWWTAHKKADALRKAKEAEEKAKKDAEEKLRKEAIAKLTPEEIAAYGLKVTKAGRGRKK